MFILNTAIFHNRLFQIIEDKNDDDDDEHLVYVNENNFLYIPNHWHSNRQKQHFHKKVRFFLVSIKFLQITSSECNKTKQFLLTTNEFV